MLELGGILSLPKYLCQTATRLTSPQRDGLINSTVSSVNSAVGPGWVGRAPAGEGLDCSAGLKQGLGKIFPMNNQERVSLLYPISQTVFTSKMTS